MRLQLLRASVSLSDWVAQGVGRLDSLFHEDDVRHSRSLDEQLRSPPNLGNQRVGLDAKLVHVLGFARQSRILAQLDAVAGNSVAADVRFSGIGLTIDGFVDRHRVAPVWGQIEPRREYQRLLEKRAATGVDVRAWQIAGHRIRTGAAAARRQERQSGGEDDDTSFCHINSYE